MKRCRFGLTMSFALILLVVGCSEKSKTYKGKVVLDRSKARQIEATWVTSKASGSSDPDDLLTDLHYPVDVAIGPGDSVFVADMGTHRIVVYSPDGKPVRTIGRVGQGPGEFGMLMSICIDHQGRIWVGEMGKLQVLSPSGACMAMTTEIRFKPLNPVLRALPDDRVWVGMPTGQTCHLVQQEGDWEIETADSPVRVLEGDRIKGLVQARKLGSIDLGAQILPLPSAGYVCLFPMITIRKQFSWLQEYDAGGTLLRDFDIDPASQDSSFQATKSNLEEPGFLPGFRALSLAPSGAIVLLSANPPLLCSFDPAQGRFVDVREIWMRFPGGEREQLVTALDMAIDSKGRIVVCGIAKSMDRIVLQLPWED